MVGFVFCQNESVWRLAFGFAICFYCHVTIPPLLIGFGLTCCAVLFFLFLASCLVYSTSMLLTVLLFWIMICFLALMLIDYFRYVMSDVLLESLHVCFLNQLIHISFCDTERFTYLFLQCYIFWDVSQDSKLPLHAYHVAPPDLNVFVNNFIFCIHVK